MGSRERNVILRRVASPASSRTVKERPEMVRTGVIVQSASQPSPLVVLPSSQISPASMAPLSQTGGPELGTSAEYSGPPGAVPPYAQLPWLGPAWA